jgi:excisionase family DNA binding protein
MKRRPTVALSTGQAARYCLVTADAVLYWVKRNQLPATRTLGGQFRILVEDLRDFMVARGLDTKQLDQAYGLRPHCWDVRHGAEVAPLDGSDCEDCLVRRAVARNCYEIRCALSETTGELAGCARCTYLSECLLKPQDVDAA